MASRFARFVGCCVVAGLALFSTATWAQTELSEPVQEALKKEFPEAKVTRVRPRKMAGKDVHLVYITIGKDRKSVVITEAGEIVSIENSVPVKELPAAVTETATKAAEGGELTSAYRVEARRDSKLAELPAPTVTYRIYLKRGEETGSLRVMEDGRLTSKPKYTTPAPKAQ